MMKKILLFIAMIVFISSFGVFAYKELIIEDIDGKPVRVIKVVLDGQHFVVSSVAGTGGSNLDFLANELGGDTALNGVFFCPEDYSYCKGETYSNFERVFKGDGKSYSKYWPDTGVRTIFGFTKEGEPLVVQNNESEMAGFRSDINHDRIDDLYFGLGNFPTLLLEGEYVSYVYSQEMDEKMLSRANRHFICWTEDKKTVYLGVVGRISVSGMAEYLQDNFDCWDALNLDAGYSAGMIYDGKVLQEPKRKIMDAFVILDREEYIRATSYKPFEKRKYIPEYYYELSIDDKQRVSLISDIFAKMVEKYGLDYKWDLIGIVRKFVSSEKIKNDYRARTLLNQLLIGLYTVRDMERSLKITD